MCNWCWLIIGICIGITGTVFCLTPPFYLDARKSDRMIEDLTDTILKLRRENKALRERIRNGKN